MSAFFGMVFTHVFDAYVGGVSPIAFFWGLVTLALHRG